MSPSERPKEPASSGPLAKRDERAVAWRGDEHRLRSEAAQEAGLVANEVELESYTQGFSVGMTVDDPFDSAIVARGRTVLSEQQLARAIAPALRYLGITGADVQLRVHDGDFELRVGKHAADRSKPALDSAKLALQVWIGFGLLGLAAYNFLPLASAALLWGVGLVLGAWQLRRGLASGRAMLSARLALSLAMMAQQEQLILPPAGDREPAAS